MRSQHKQNRRHRGNKPQDDEQYGPPRIDDDSYARPHRASHRSDERRASSTSSREYYDGYRDMGSHSRSRHGEGSWYPDVRGYREEDVYRRESDYDADIRRDSDWGTRSGGDTQYSSVRDEWPQQYDHPSSYHDSSSWGAAASRDAYDSRHPYYEDWSLTNSTHGSSSRVRDDDGHLRHSEKHEREDLGWSRDHRRDKGTQQSRFQTGSNWESTKRDTSWESGVAKDPQVLEDREWEPAPSWKSSHRNEDSLQNSNQSQNNGQRSSQHKQQQYSKGKRSQYSKQQRRDWRNDDSNLNNWTRRDYHTQNRKGGKNQQPQKNQRQQQQNQRYRQNHSRSRSRSPAESYHSHLSSRGRSRSTTRSPVPKRRRREASHAPRSITPSDRDAPGWMPRQGQSVYSRSPSPRHDPRPHRPRNKSVSSVSSATSGGSSRGNSPHIKSRPVHRLPTPEFSGPMDLDNGARDSQHGNAQQISSHTNGKYHTNDRPNKTADYDWLPNDSTAGSHAMPPPSIIPPRPSYPPSDVAVSEPPLTRVNISSKPNRKQSFGFKPVSRAQPTPSSSLRKFFPGDDEDIEQPPAVEPSPPSSLMQPEHGYRALSGKGVWPPPEPLEESQMPSQSSWPIQEQAHPRPEPTYNGQVTAKPSPRPSTSEPMWNGDGTERRTVPSPNSVINYEPQQPPYHKPTKSLVPSAQPSPTTQFALAKPLLPLSATPPLTSSILPIPVAAESVAPKDLALLVDKPVYNILVQVGEGTFGKVYKARHSVSGLLVALKRIRMETEKDGFPVTAMREIKLLQSLRHENVVQLYEMIVSNGSVYMVFEYNHHDLTGILSQTQFEFTVAHLKSLCHQMLAGLAYLHHKGVIHRDIKGSNILINNRGELKLADFGLARFFQKRRRLDYTNRVITLWYRPPELLFGATVYGPEVDMWSAGCIMLELFTKKPVFQGNDEIHQLDVIHKILGTPTSERWITFTDLPWYELAKPRDEIPNRFRDIFQKWMSPAALDLAEQLLEYDPLRRLSALQALEAPYFTQEMPAAELPTGLASVEGEWHELETKRERAKKRKKVEGSA